MEALARALESWGGGGVLLIKDGVRTLRKLLKIH